MTIATVKTKSGVQFDSLKEFGIYLDNNPQDFVELELVDIIDDEPVVTNVIHVGDAVEYCLIWGE